MHLFWRKSASGCFWKCVLWNWEKSKITYKEFWIYIKNRFLTSISRNKLKCLFLFHDWFPIKFVFTCNIFGMLWEIYSEHLISTRLNQKKIKSCRKKMSCERALNFEQCKTFYESYKPVRVWLWLVRKLLKHTENYFRLRLFSEFIQEVSCLSWQNPYPNLKTTCHIKLNFFCELNS